MPATAARSVPLSCEYAYCARTSATGRQRDPFQLPSDAAPRPPAVLETENRPDAKCIRTPKYAAADVLVNWASAWRPICSPLLWTIGKLKPGPALKSTGNPASFRNDPLTDR